MSHFYLNLSDETFENFLSFDLIQTHLQLILYISNLIFSQQSVSSSSLAIKMFASLQANILSVDFFITCSVFRLTESSMSANFLTRMTHVIPLNQSMNLLINVFAYFVITADRYVIFCTSIFRYH